MFTVTHANNTPVVYCRPHASQRFWNEPFRALSTTAVSTMRTRVKETEEAYLFDAELPGFSPEEIDLSVQDGVLTIAAEHKEGDEDGPLFSARSVCRSFTLDGICEEDISAQYKNGVLRVTLPKTKAPEVIPARRIEIQ